MGLSISVGLLAEALAFDPEEGARCREVFAAVNRALENDGVSTHLEPESLLPLRHRAPIQDIKYGCLHQLIRFRAHRVRRPNAMPPPLPVGQQAAEDPLIRQASDWDQHLLLHSDAEGFYVPVDFEMVIEDEGLPGRFLGSTQRLMQELIEIAPPLGISLHDGQLGDEEAHRLSALIRAEEGPYHVEQAAWLLLFECARLSIQHGTAVHYS